MVIIIILCDHHRICGPSLTETSLCGACLFTFKPDKIVVMNLKDKAIPFQAWRDPEGSRRLRVPDFKTVSTWRW